MLKNSPWLALLTVQVLGLLAVPAMAQPDFTPAWSKGIGWYQLFPIHCPNKGEHYTTFLAGR